MKCAIFAWLINHDEIRYVETIEVKTPFEALSCAKDHAIKLYKGLEEKGEVLSFVDCLKEAYQSEVNNKEGLYDKALFMYQNEVERLIRYNYFILPKD